MKEELKQPKTDIRLWILTVVFCQKKKHVYWLCFNYLLLLNVVIGFGYCNHWNLTHNIMLGKEKGCVQLVWNGYYCIGEKVEIEIEKKKY